MWNEKQEQNQHRKQLPLVKQIDICLLVKPASTMWLAKCAHKHLISFLDDVISSNGSCGFLIAPALENQVSSF